jgi:hypothetical protein
LEWREVAVEEWQTWSSSSRVKLLLSLALASSTTSLSFDSSSPMYCMSQAGRQAGRIPKIPSGSKKKNSHQITACNTSTHTDLAGNETCKMIIKELEKL